MSKRKQKIIIDLDESEIDVETIERYAQKARSIFDGTYKGHKKDATVPKIDRNSIIVQKMLGHIK
ncbi:hypothetical protein C1N61_29895 (plasmid) [Priestia aryabhattai]